MPLEDYLLPNEQIRYQSEFDVFYSGKPYTVILTDLRLVLYSRRGLLIKNDDVVTEAIRDIQGIKYREMGLIVKSGELIISGKTRMHFGGSKDSMKALYQRLLPFLSPEYRTAQYQQPPSPSYAPIPPSSYVPAPPSSMNCPNCGIELPSNARFRNSCGKQMPWNE